MKRVWWAQVKAVIRLEIRKTFFARRGLWIYFLALLPVLLFVGYSIANSHQLKQSSSVARRGEKPLTYQDLLAVHSGMTKEEVTAALGRPAVVFHWDDRRDEESGKSDVVKHEEYRYSDGVNDLYVSLADGKVENTHIQEGYNLGRDSIMFAGVFQFFFLRLAVFFGCLGIFMNLFRGEILDRSLHFYFLAPDSARSVDGGKVSGWADCDLRYFRYKRTAAKCRIFVASLTRSARSLSLSQSWIGTCPGVSRGHDARVRRIRGFLPCGGDAIQESDTADRGDFDLGRDQPVSSRRF